MYRDQLENLFVDIGASRVKRFDRNKFVLLSIFALQRRFAQKITAQGNKSPILVNVTSRMDFNNMESNPHGQQSAFSLDFSAQTSQKSSTKTYYHVKNLMEWTFSFSKSAHTWCGHFCIIFFDFSGVQAKFIPSY